MNRNMTTRLDKLEGADAGGALVFLWVDPGRKSEAEAEAARLTAKGRRVVFVGWLDGDDGAG